MEAGKATYETFLLDVRPQDRPFVDGMHAYFLENGCTPKVEVAKSGYVVSYVHKAQKRTVMNYVFRKKGMFVRLYADNLKAYASMLETLPEGMQKALEKAPVCRRLLDPEKCNARCPMGNVFRLHGQEHKKCRYTSFLMLVDEVSQPHIRALAEREMGARLA